MENIEEGAMLEAPVDMEWTMGVKLEHNGIGLEIDDLAPKTIRGRISNARKILAYNRAVRKSCAKKGIPFGDENTPYHFWDIDLAKVLEG